MKPLAAPLLLAAAVGVAAAAAASQTTFRSGVNLVRLQVLVTQDGRPVSGLEARDFEVTDNGVRQHVESVFAELLPLDVLLVMDRSASMAGQPLTRLKTAAHELVKRLRPEDRCGLVTFSHWVSLDVDLTGDRERIGLALNDLQADGLTSVLDAVYGALLVGLDPGRRTLILLFSDGLDSHSWTLAAEVTVLAQQSDAIIAAVAWSPDRGSAGSTVDTAPPNIPFLRSLADDTGGEAVVATRLDEFSGAFASLLERARSRYLITYYPQGPERTGWHEVRVKLRARRGEVVARRGYNVPAGREIRRRPIPLTCFGE